MSVAMGFTATLSSTAAMSRLREIGFIGRTFDALSWFTPYGLIIASFTFLYLFVPNTRVRFIPALIGGALAGVLWAGGGALFTSFVVSVSRAEAIYSGFAIVVVAMAWLHLSWLILLLGDPARVLRAASRVLAPRPTRAERIEHHTRAARALDHAARRPRLREARPRLAHRKLGGAAPSAAPPARARRGGPHGRRTAHADEREPADSRRAICAASAWSTSSLRSAAANAIRTTQADDDWNATVVDRGRRRRARDSRARSATARSPISSTPTRAAARPPT